ncbi:MAG: Flp pilus assembly protein CpaB [Candidatus Binatia bacterium]
MQNRLRLAIVVALSFGLIAAYGIFNFLRQQREQAEEFRRSTQNVVIAAKEIPAGAAITADMLKMSLHLKTSIPPGAFSSPGEVTGKIAKTTIVAGEPILPARLGDKGGLTVLLTPGYRAMAVRVNEIIGVSGFIAPNDRVDVIALVTPPAIANEDAKQISKIVLQNKRVLSVAQTVEERKEGKPQVASSITLELTPEEAEKLSLASLEGQIVLALRASQDEGIVRTEGSTTRDLLNIAAPPPPAPIQAEAPPPPPAAAVRYRVEVYTGGRRSEYEF